MPNENLLEKPKEMYDVTKHIVQSAFWECINMGWSKEAASGKTLYEVESAEKDGTSLERKMIYLELCYLFAKEDVQEAFNRVIGKLKKEMQSSDHFKLYEGCEELNEFKEEIDSKEKIIIEYAIQKQ